MHECHNELLISIQGYLPDSGGVALCGMTDVNVSVSEKRGNFAQNAKFGIFQAITISKQ